MVFKNNASYMLNVNLCAYSSVINYAYNHVRQCFQQSFTMFHSGCNIYSFFIKLNVAMCLVNSEMIYEYYVIYVSYKCTSRIMALITAIAEVTVFIVIHLNVSLVDCLYG